jgi:hypothetical protein
MAVYRSAKGALIDMGRLESQNELTVAVSNVRINARGDELGPNGQIIRKQPDVAHVPATGTRVEQYVAPAPQPVITEQPKYQPVVSTPAPVVEPAVTEPAVTESQKPNNNKGRQ